MCIKKNSNLWWLLNSFDSFFLSLLKISMKPFALLTSILKDFFYIKKGQTINHTKKKSFTKTMYRQIGLWKRWQNAQTTPWIASVCTVFAYFGPQRLLPKIWIKWTGDRRERSIFWVLLEMYWNVKKCFHDCITLEVN